MLNLDSRIYHLKLKTLLKNIAQIYDADKFLFSSDVIFLLHPPIRISFVQLFVLDSRNISKSRCQMLFGNNHQWIPDIGQFWGDFIIFLDIWGLWLVQILATRKDFNVL